MAMTPRQFMEEVYEIAFGENVYYRGFFPEEVLETLKGFSDNALILEESYRRGYKDGRKFALQQQEKN